MSEAYKTIAEVLISHFGLDPTTVRPEATIKELDIDSLSLVELAVVLQDRYGFEVEGIDQNATLAQVSSQLLDAAPGVTPVQDTAS